MGCVNTKKYNKRKFQKNIDKFKSYDDIKNELKKQGFKKSELIIGIDFSKKNMWRGGLPYHNYMNLHSISTSDNPYQKAIKIMCKSLSSYDSDQLIPTYGFGLYDYHICNNNNRINNNDNNDNNLISFKTEYGNNVPCYKLEGVLNEYLNMTKKINNGILQQCEATSFIDIIYKTIEIVKQTKEYTILIILCNSGIDRDITVHEAVIKASKYPISIICIGIGKGPWDFMKTFDDKIPKRKFDNFQFINFHEIMKENDNDEFKFAINALMEIPAQWKYIKKHLI